MTEPVAPMPAPPMTEPAEPMPAPPPTEPAEPMPAPPMTEPAEPMPAPPALLQTAKATGSGSFCCWYAGVYSGTPSGCDHCKHGDKDYGLAEAACVGPSATWCPAGATEPAEP